MKIVFSILSFILIATVPARAMTFKNSTTEPVNFAYIEEIGKHKPGNNDTIVRVLANQTENVSLLGLLDDLKHKSAETGKAATLSFHANMVFCDPTPIYITSKTNVEALDSKTIEFIHLPDPQKPRNPIYQNKCTIK